MSITFASKMIVTIPFHDTSKFMTIRGQHHRIWHDNLGLHVKLCPF